MLGFFKIAGKKLVVKYVSTYKVKQDQQMNYLIVLTRCVFFSDFLSKSICCGYSFELHRQDAIQMGTHSIYLYKRVDKKYRLLSLQNYLTVHL